jgi:TM2 domain-containing membrane protein YozV
LINKVKVLVETKLELAKLLIVGSVVLNILLSVFAGLFFYNVEFIQIAISVFVALLIAGLTFFAGFVGRKVVAGLMLFTYVILPFVAVLFLISGSEFNANWILRWLLGLPGVNVLSGLFSIFTEGFDGIMYTLSALVLSIGFFTALAVAFFEKKKKPVISGIDAGLSVDASATWGLIIPGVDERNVTTSELRSLILSGAVNSQTLIRDMKNNLTFPAGQIPGMFSKRQYVTTLLLSFFLGGLGVDRLYLGQTGLGIAKLLTVGGCGVWALVDLILIAMRKVKDNEGLPLA